MGESAGDEIFPQRRIVQAVALLHRQAGQGPGDGRRVGAPELKAVRVSVNADTPRVFGLEPLYAAEP
jgi:hypothetical protein